MSWNVYVVEPVLIADPRNRGRMKFAKGLIQTEELFVKSRTELAEARNDCLRLCLSVIRENAGKTTLGFGIRNSYMKRKSKFFWFVSVQQVRAALERREQKAAAASVKKRKKAA